MKIEYMAPNMPKQKTGSSATAQNRRKRPSLTTIPQPLRPAASTWRAGWRALSGRVSRRKTATSTRNDRQPTAAATKSWRRDAPRVNARAPSGGPPTTPTFMAVRSTLKASARCSSGSRSAVMALAAVWNSGQPKAPSMPTRMATCQAWWAAARPTNQIVALTAATIIMLLRPKRSVSVPPSTWKGMTAMVTRPNTAPTTVNEMWQRVAHVHAFEGEAEGGRAGVDEGADHEEPELAREGVQVVGEPRHRRPHALPPSIQSPHLPRPACPSWAATPVVAGHAICESKAAHPMLSKTPRTRRARGAAPPRRSTRRAVPPAPPPW